MYIVCLFLRKNLFIYINYLCLNCLCKKEVIGCCFLEAFMFNRNVSLYERLGLLEMGMISG